MYVVMVNTAGAYWKLGHYAEVESIATKTKDTLGAAGLTKCYVFAERKRLFSTVLNVIATIH